MEFDYCLINATERKRKEKYQRVISRVKFSPNWRPLWLRSAGLEHSAGVGVASYVSVQQEAGQLHRCVKDLEPLSNNVICAQGYLAGEQLHFYLRHLLSELPAHWFQCHLPLNYQPWFPPGLRDKLCLLAVF